MNLLPDTPCVVCGAPAARTCDDCRVGLCWEHASVETQPWDPAGWDGVDIRCPVHQRAQEVSYA